MEKEIKDNKTAYNKGKKAAADAILNSVSRHKIEKEIRNADNFEEILKYRGIMKNLSKKKVEDLEDVVKYSEKTDKISIDIKDDAKVLNTRSFLGEFDPDGNMSLHTIKGQSSVLDKDIDGKGHEIKNGENSEFFKNVTKKSLDKETDKLVKKEKENASLKEDNMNLNESSWDSKWASLDSKRSELNKLRNNGGLTSEEKTKYKEIEGDLFKLLPKRIKQLKRLKQKETPGEKPEETKKRLEIEGLKKSLVELKRQRKETGNSNENSVKINKINNKLKALGVNESVLNDSTLLNDYSDNEILTEGLFSRLKKKPKQQIVKNIVNPLDKKLEMELKKLFSSNPTKLTQSEKNIILEYFLMIGAHSEENIKNVIGLCKIYLNSKIKRVGSKTIILDTDPHTIIDVEMGEIYDDEDEILTEGQNSEYKKYIKEHISNVQKGYRWLKKYLPELFEDRKFTEKFDDYLTIKKHDKSKYNKKDELNAYQKHFYGKPEEKEANRPNFDHAWNHHQKINKHHWQYWVLVRGDGSHKTLDMPYRYIIEMICDWWSFSWKSGHLNEIFDWWNKNKSGMILSQNTRSTIEMILGKMKKKLQDVGSEVLKESFLSKLTKKDTSNNILYEFKFSDDLTSIYRDKFNVQKEGKETSVRFINDSLTEGMIQTIKDKLNNKKIEEIKPEIKKSLDDELRILESKKTVVTQILHNILDDYDDQQNDMIAELSEKLERDLILQSITPAISKQSVLKNIKNHTKFFRFVYFNSNIENPEDYIIFDTKKVWCFKNIKSNGELSSLIRPSQQKMKENSRLISEINKNLEYSMSKEWFNSLPEYYKSAIRVGSLTPSEVKEKMRKESLKKLSLRESEFHDDLEAIYGIKKHSIDDCIALSIPCYDVLEEIKDIRYGFIDKNNGKIYEDRDWIHNCPNLSDYYETNFNPEETLKNKLGICLDQSIAVKHLFNKLHPEYDCKIMALTKGRFGHAVPIFRHPGDESGKEWYYLENAWDKERGLHGGFSTEEELKKYLEMLYHKHHDKDNSDPVVVQTYEEFKGLSESINLLPNIYYNSEKI